jgi:hypothetical protein
MYDKLPRVRYITPQGYKEVSDITTTFRVKQIAIDEGAYPIQATVPEGDRPEIYSDRVYGKSTYHWLILNMNQKVNPYYEWVLSPSSFDNYVNEKYPGYTLFLLSVNGVNGFTGSFRTNDIVFATGVTNPNLQPSIESSLKNARVVDFDPAYCRLVMEFTQKTAWLPQEGDYIAGANTNARGDVNYYVAKIGKVIESPYAAHHFENTDGELLNPTLPVTLHNKFVGSSDFGYTFGVTPLGKYILDDFGSYTITNREHESTINDANRTITLISSQYIRDVDRDIETILNNG